MSFNHYYQSELSALRQMGKRFAERSPALAPFLGQSGRDPDVERLLEGFAFLTGRLRQKLDDELPELTHSLMYLLWPNYMRPLPAFSILQFESLDNAGAAVVVPRGTPVESRPVKGVACRFRTTSNIELTALNIRQVDYSVKGHGAMLSVQVGINGGARLADIKLERLRLHLAGERYISQALYLSMMRHLEDIQIVLLDTQGKPLKDSFGKDVTPLKISPDQLQPTGFAEDEALVPYPVNTFRGYRYLQEYFAFQEKFLFVDLHGLSVLHGLQEDLLKRAAGFELRFDLRQTSAQRIRPNVDNIRLHCTPIVNLFSHDATPIRLDGRQDKYMLRPAEYDTAQCGVFSVDRVTGWKPGGMGYEEYVPFESFEHDASFDFPEARPYYSLRQTPSLMNDGVDTYLSFGQRSLEIHETLSVELTCTNQNLPLELALGDICRASEGTPEFLRFRNISAVTPNYAPPLHHDFLWKLISNMSLNYLSLANVEALKVILETYDLPRHYDQHAAKVSRRLLNGLKAIQHNPVDRLYRGLPVRGVRTELSMDSDGYLGEGDLFLFASILNEFFSLYASLNSYHELEVKSTNGELYQWTPRMGQKPLL
ncbi:type VI secretion system baseplate subunit TssF [uncultured Halopseudomonas sp.]|uniref:type VI secretion system baseplate subunit TssF n=1 Tax=uncultured Halopseudomonas sp. TaxID=2901193 RepID=UPI0030EF6E2B|tara:strand:- start:17117 stop:18907 length:1791 start_codon:yes stop_codon:yes gene_type:complete